MKLSPAVQKFAYWSSGFFFPFAILFIAIIFSDWILTVDRTYTTYAPWIKIVLGIITGFEIVQIAFLKCAKLLAIEIEKNNRHYIIWGLVSWFFFAIALFILLPLSFVLLYS